MCTYSAFERIGLKSSIHLQNWYRLQYRIICSYLVSWVLLTLCIRQTRVSYRLHPYRVRQTPNKRNSPGGIPAVCRRHTERYKK